MDHLPTVKFLGIYKHISLGLAPFDTILLMKKILHQFVMVNCLQFFEHPNWFRLLFMSCCSFLSEVYTSALHTTSGWQIDHGQTRRVVGFARPIESFRIIIWILKFVSKHQHDISLSRKKTHRLFSPIIVGPVDTAAAPCWCWCGPAEWFFRILTWTSSISQPCGS